MLTTTNKKHTLIWFRNRVRQVVCRVEKGEKVIPIRIVNKDHARYLFTIQNEMGVRYY